MGPGVTGSGAGGAGDLKEPAKALQEAVQARGNGLRAAERQMDPRPGLSPHSDSVFWAPLGWEGARASGWPALVAARSCTSCTAPQLTSGFRTQAPGFESWSYNFLMLSLGKFLRFFCAPVSSV
jgi:hypothetical protein